MEQLQIQEEQTGLSARNTKKMLHIYQMVKTGNLRDSLAYMLLASNESFSMADKDAARVVQQKVKTRSSYSGRSGKLMDYTFDENVDRSTDEVIIDLLTVAINDYLSDKQEKPQKESELNKVKVLMMQLISKGVTNILSDINIPPYVMSMVKETQDMLDERFDEVFNSWCMDLEETGNEHLVDWMRKEVGPAIFGLGVDTKAKDKYNQFMDEFVSSINNPAELYNRYLKRRADYTNCSERIMLIDLYEIFDISSDQYNKIQKNLFNDFQLRYSENTNAKYIKELLNG